MASFRPELSGDLAAIHGVNERAFGQPDEANLVDALRLDAHPFISIVATESGDVVGHICFSPVTIGADDSPSSMGLAPMAVVPERQGQGIGSQLVRVGLDACRQQGAQVVVVVGHARFYPRFGFVPGRTKGLTCEYPVPDEVFMVTELVPDALAGRVGLVRYHPAFGRL